MAIRTFALAIDNHPVYGFAPVLDISGTGVLRLKTGTRRIQAAVVAFAEQHSTPHEFIPSSGAKLYFLPQSTPSTDYDIASATVASSNTEISVLDNATVIHSATPVAIPQQGYQLAAGVLGPNGISLLTNEYAAVDPLYMITHETAEVKGLIRYLGTGTDVSATYSLAAGTRFGVMTGVSRSDDLAEMVFVDGEQIEGDVYDYLYSYGTGAYQLIYTDDSELHVQLATPVDTGTKTLLFAIFQRKPRPMIRVREDSPFSIDEDGDYGVWVEYFNIPKGDMILNYWLQ